MMKLISKGVYMKQITSIFAAFLFVLMLTFMGNALGSNGTLSVSAQDTMLGKAGDTVTDVSKSVAKKVGHTTRRVGTTVGKRTWTGTKWVASKSWKGGKWVAVKTVHGTKWVYKKGKNTVKGAVKGSTKPIP